MITQDFVLQQCPVRPGALRNAPVGHSAWLYPHSTHKPQLRPHRDLLTSSWPGAPQPLMSPTASPAALIWLLPGLSQPSEPFPVCMRSLVHLYAFITPPPQFPRSALMPPHFLLGLAHPLCPSSSSSQLPGKERSPGLWHPSCQPTSHSAAHWWHLPG